MKWQNDMFWICLFLLFHFIWIQLIFSACCCSTHRNQDVVHKAHGTQQTTWRLKIGGDGGESWYPVAGIRYIAKDTIAFFSRGEYSFYACCMHTRNAGPPKKARFAWNMNVCARAHRVHDKHTSTTHKWFRTVYTVSEMIGASRHIQAYNVYQSTIRPTTEKINRSFNCFVGRFVCFGKPKIIPKLMWSFSPA